MPHGLPAFSKGDIMRTLLLAAYAATAMLLTTAAAAKDDDAKQLTDAAIEALKAGPGKLLRAMADLSDSATGVEGPTPTTIAPRDTGPREWIDGKSHQECLAENHGQENVVYHRCRHGYSRPVQK